MKKESLTHSQLLAAKELDKTLKSLTSIRDQLSHYKLGDIFILEEWYIHNPKIFWVNKTHMGFPTKYKVVFISSEGIPYLRKITTTGNPTGNCLLPPEAKVLRCLEKFVEGDNTNSISFANSVYQRFVPDPEQLDSILLQQEFDPMAQHRDKSKLYNEINKHNKKALVPTSLLHPQSVANFFKSRQPGDRFWTSPNKQYVIQSVTKVWKEYEITCTDMNSVTVTFNFRDFYNKRLYKEQPRSFCQESQK